MGTWEKISIRSPEIRLLENRGHLRGSLKMGDGMHD